MRKIEFMQVTINDGIFQLSPSALKVLIFLGMHAHKSGFIKVKQKELGNYLGCKSTQIKKLFKELLDCDAIEIAVPAKGHEPATYKVSQKLFNKGYYSTTEWKPPVQPELLVRDDFVSAPFVYGDAVVDKRGTPYVEVSFVKAKRLDH